MRRLHCYEGTPSFTYKSTFSPSLALFQVLVKMTDLRWTYDELVKYWKVIDQSPSSAGTLNPLVQELLRACPGSFIFGISGHSVVLQVSPEIAAKICLRPGDDRLRNEQAIFKLLDQSECPHLVRCFFRGADVTFLELLAHGTLHDRLSVDKPRPVLRWMLQLSSAAACLEALGYAHGDINPRNILLDAHDQVKLIDFDHAFTIGHGLDVGYEPYVRQHREMLAGVFGAAGPATEQFTLGSVFWYMTRGSELYAELPGPEQVDRLLDGIFPATDPQDPIDRIIGNCWNGHYVRVADLVEDITSVLGLEKQSRHMMSAGQRRDRMRLCGKYYSLIMPTIEGAKADLPG